jgi:hypothetical protein
MSESDYPHSDSRWPHTRNMLEEVMADVPDGLQGASRASVQRPAIHSASVLAVERIQADLVTCPRPALTPLTPSPGRTYDVSTSILEYLLLILPVWFLDQWGGPELEL